MRNYNAGKVYLALGAAAVFLIISLFACVLAFAQGDSGDAQNSAYPSADTGARQQTPSNGPTLQRPAAEAVGGAGLQPASAATA